MAPTTESRPTVDLAAFDAAEIGLSDGLRLVASVWDGDELPAPILAIVRKTQQPDQGARDFVFSFASALRRSFLDDPQNAELAEWATLAHDLLAQALGRGADRVLHEERRVWRELARALACGEASNETEAELCSDFEESLWWWSASGELLDELYQAQRQLFVSTEGRIAEIDLEARRRAHPAPSPGPVEGVLGNLSTDDLHATARQLERDGCLMYPGAVPEEICVELERFSRETPSRAILGGDALGDPTPWNSERAEVTRAVIPDGVGLTHPEIRSLAFDPTLLAIARSYLGTEVTLTKALLRWSAPVFDEPDPKAAQLFHFDLNRLNFIKAFVYLGDVGPENGPHVFVRGSHRHRPHAVNHDGRLDWDEVAAVYPEEDILELTAPRGTLIIADTRGLHLGKMLTQGDRIVLNLVYSSSIAGKKLRELDFAPDETARREAQLNPRLWYGLIRP